MLNKLKNFKWGYILLFILLMAVGVCFLGFHNTLETLALIIGILVVIFGIVFFVITLAAKKRGGGFAFRVIISMCCIVAGIITIVFRADAIEVLASLFGLFLIIDGSFKLQTVIMSKRYKLVSWWLMLVPAVLVIIGGFLSTEFKIDPSTNEQTVISIILGITIILDAISNFLSAFYISGYEKSHKKELIEELRRQGVIPADNTDIISDASDNTDKNNS